MSTKFSYEKTMEEIETIIGDIENNRLDVDQLTDAVARVGELLAKCKRKLADARAIVDGLEEKMNDGLKSE